MTNAPSNPYDDIRYPGYVYARTHPDHLAAVATVFGMTPAPPERCRVLEVACGDGGNLVPMAFGLPGSRFTGFDLAAGPIADAQSFAKALGLTNLDLRALDLLDAPAAFGPFDYIIAHGFYSWVPDEVRRRLLDACARWLAPNGVAFISYRARPGDDIRQMVRRMILYHIEGAPDARTRVGQARALLDFLAEGATDEDGYGPAVRTEANSLRRYDPAHLFHDDLAPVCDAFWFYEFVERAGRAGLKFLSDVDLEVRDDPRVRKGAYAVLRKLHDRRLAREQYLDFVKGRRFRQTLLVHHAVEAAESPDPGALRRLRAASPSRPSTAACDPVAEGEVEFRTIENHAFKVSHPYSKAALLELGSRWPCSLGFDELLDRVRARLGRAGSAEDARTLGEVLLEGWGLGVVDIRTAEPAFAVTPGERPLASPLTRLQIQLGRPVSNARHEPVQAHSVLEGPLLQLCDGTRDRAALARDLAAALARVPVGAGGDAPPAEPADVTEAGVGELLASLARRALLIG